MGLCCSRGEFGTELSAELGDMPGTELINSPDSVNRPEQWRGQDRVLRELCSVRGQCSRSVAPTAMATQGTQLSLMSNFAQAAWDLSLLSLDQVKPNSG